MLVRMSRAAPRRRTRWLLSAAALGALLSQLGHTIAYAERCGACGPELVLLPAGMHAYFAGLFQLSTAAGGAALVAGLLLVGAVRLAAGRRLDLRLHDGVPLLDLFLVTGAVQLQVYVVQETAEALLAGQALDAGFLLTALAFGLTGQLPVALLAALALRWLSIRLHAAIRVLRAVGTRPPGARGAPAPAGRRWVAPRRQTALAQSAPAALVKRGPPRLLRLPC